MNSVGIKKDELLTLSRIEIYAVYNHAHNILKFFDVLPNFSFATSKMERSY